MHSSKPSPLTSFNPAPWVAHRQAGGNLKWLLWFLSGFFFPFPAFLLKSQVCWRPDVLLSSMLLILSGKPHGLTPSAPSLLPLPHQSGKKDGLILIPQQTGQFHWPQASPHCSQQRTFLKIFLYWSLHKCLTRCINVPSQATTESSHYFMSVTIWNLIKYLALITCVNPNASFTEWFTERNPARIVQMEHFYGASFFPKHVWVYCT